MDLPKRAAILSVLGLSIAVFVGHGIDQVIVHDEGVFVVTNIEVANGNLPYTEAFDNTGPIGPWYGGAGVALGRHFDMDAVRSARLIYLPVAVAAVVMTFFLGLKARLSTLAALVAAFALLAIPSFSRVALSGPRPKMIVVALVTGYLIALGHRRFAVAGMLLGIATLTWQPIFLLSLVPVVMTLWKRCIPAWSDVSRFVLGGSLSLIPVMATYVAAGQLDTLVEGFITWNLGLGQNRLPSSIGDAFLNPLKDVWGANQATWPLLVAGGLAVLPFFRKTVGGPIRDDSEGNLFLDLTTVGFIVLSAWTLIDYQGVNDLLPFMPLAALGAGRITDWLLQRSRPAAATLLVVLIVCAGVDLFRNRGDELVRQEVELEALIGSGCVASYGGPVALALSGDSNPSRFFFLVPGLDEHLGEGAFDHMERLTAGRPVFIAGPVDFDGGHLAEAVDTVLPESGYEEVSTERFEGWILDGESSGGDGRSIEGGAESCHGLVE